MLVLGYDLCKDISFSFYSLATSEEDIKEYAFLESSEGFSVYFMPLEVLIPDGVNRQNVDSWLNLNFDKPQVF